MLSNTTSKIRRALISVSDKGGVQELAQALHSHGAEIVATGNTARVLKEAGIPVTPIEKLSGSPEAFQGRMKTLSFPVCSGILYRRKDASDEKDLARLAIQPIDCVVVNFYPFEEASKKSGITRKELIEEVDIGGPTLVRAAAKNAPDVLVLTHPAQYPGVITELRSGGVSDETSLRCASQAWDHVFRYDQAIARELGSKAGVKKLRYGENPHQSGSLEFEADSPIAWETQLTVSELSYNNILDLSAAYALAGDLREIAPGLQGVVIVKHNNPCGVALARTQMEALERAWEGDPVSAFGGVVVFTHALEEPVATWLAGRFIELVAAPGLNKNSSSLLHLIEKRRNLKALGIRSFGDLPREGVVLVPGGKLYQSTDTGFRDEFRCVTRAPWTLGKNLDGGSVTLSKFGIAVCRALKSNAITLVRELPGGAGMQLVGAGQGQPNRIDALKQLAVPRASEVLKSGGELGTCVMVSDAFFPFRDTVDAARDAGIRFIIQPGGSIKDQESITACDEAGISMVFTGVRHFRH